VSFADTTKTPAVALVNQQFARQLFHTEHAVGRYFKNSDGVSIQIVGIVGDGKYFSLSEEPDEAAFFPITQHPGTKASLIVRTRSDASEAAVNEMRLLSAKSFGILTRACPFANRAPGGTNWA